MNAAASSVIREAASASWCCLLLWFWLVRCGQRLLLVNLSMVEAGFSM